MTRRGLVTTEVHGVKITTGVYLIEEGIVDIRQQWTNEHGRAANACLLIAVKDFPEFVRGLQMLAAELPS